MKSHTTAHLKSVTITLAAIGLMLCRVAGDDQVIGDPTGIWRVNSLTTNNHTVSTRETLKLGLAGNTLAGSLVHSTSVNGKQRVFEWPITEGKFQGNNISFTVSHRFEVGNGTVTSRYQGVLNGNLMAGTYKTEFFGNVFERNWQAQRIEEPVTNSFALAEIAR